MREETAKHFLKLLAALERVKQVNDYKNIKDLTLDISLQRQPAGSHITQEDI